jgi:hypothetical protein
MDNDDDDDRMDVVDKWTLRIIFTLGISLS